MSDSGVWVYMKCVFHVWLWGVCRVCACMCMRCVCWCVRCVWVCEVCLCKRCVLGVRMC